MKRIVSFFLTLVCASALLLPGSFALATGATTGTAKVSDTIQQNTSAFKTVQGGVANDSNNLMTIIANVINILLGFVGLILVIMLIYGGFLWMTDGGDETQVKNAKHILKNATVGVIIVILAFAISNFVIGQIVISMGGTPS